MSLRGGPSYDKVPQWAGALGGRFGPDDVGYGAILPHPVAGAYACCAASLLAGNGMVAMRKPVHTVLPCLSGAYLARHACSLPSRRLLR